MSITADAPEIARLLMLASQWRFALKRMTPMDVTAQLIHQTLKSTGIHLDLAAMEAIASEMREGVYPGKNVHDVITSPQFQERITQAIMIEDDSDQPLDHEDREVMFICKHCGQAGLYDLAQ